jgi:hypothetical protein
MLTPLAVIVGLLIAFLASRVWSNLDLANSYVSQEASAIRESILLADTLPEDARTAVRSAIKQYLQFIEADDWPAMAQGRASLRRALRLKVACASRLGPLNDSLSVSPRLTRCSLTAVTSSARLGSGLSLAAMLALLLSLRGDRAEPPPCGMIGTGFPVQRFPGGA